MLDAPAESSLEKVEWSQVTNLGDQISKQATSIGMLWNREALELKELEESLGAYFNLLHGFLLSCHGSTVGAGSTLHASIRIAAKQVMESSLSLLREAVSSYGSSGSTKTSTVPPLVGSVWEACTALKKTPTTNHTAIGRAVARVAVSVKDVLREMRELKNPDKFDDGSSDDGLGDNLSPEEMTVVPLIIDIASTSFDALKEVIRFVLGLLESSELDTEDFVASLEKLLGHCEEIGSEVNELGACVYPPQETSAMIAAAKKIDHEIRKIQEDAESMGSSTEKLLVSFEELVGSLERLESRLAGNLVEEVDKIVL